MSVNGGDSARHIGVVEQPGPRTIVVDDGRSGWAHVAVTRAGAYDRGAYRRANRLAGNRPAAAALEILLGPMRIAFTAAATLALTGVQASIDVIIGGVRRAVDCETTLTVPANSILDIATFDHGLRGYLAIRGGWGAQRVLGSRSADTLSGLGPPQLHTGDLVSLAEENEEFPQHDSNSSPFRLRAAADELPLRLLPAPRAATAPLAHWLMNRRWLVSADSDRVGMRLQPMNAERAPDGWAGGQPADSPSEPLVRGAVQVTPAGVPVIMGPDHPTTGGYPIAGVVTEHDSDALAQLRPGAIVRFVAVMQ